MIFTIDIHYGKPECFSFGVLLLEPIKTFSGAINFHIRPKIEGNQLESICAGTLLRSKAETIESATKAFTLK